jgi:hypothetical protein
MTQEEKDLLLRDLCARLPYGVKMQKFNDQNIVVDLYAINLNSYTIDFYTYKGKSLTIANTSKLARSGILLYKPCLFPLSSMTEEQKKEEYEICKYHLIGYESKLIDFYHKNHLDYQDLISKGLAIDATNLNIY